MSSRANARALLTLLLAGILGGRPARAYGRRPRRFRRPMRALAACNLDPHAGRRV